MISLNLSAVLAVDDIMFHSWLLVVSSGIGSKSAISSELDWV